MKELGYSEGYKYAHDYENHFVKQQFLPDELNGTQLWTPQPNAAEDKMKERMRFLWGNKGEG
jgi:putative ATPase